MGKRDLGRTLVRLSDIFSESGLAPGSTTVPVTGYAIVFQREVRAES